MRALLAFQTLLKKNLELKQKTYLFDDIGREFQLRKTEEVRNDHFEQSCVSLLIVELKHILDQVVSKRILNQAL